MTISHRNGHSSLVGHQGVKGSSGTKKLKSRTGVKLIPGIPEQLNAKIQTTASLSAWGYVNQINTQTVAVGANVTFSNNGPLNGINHTPGAAAIGVTQAGTYNLTFSVYTTQNNPQDWAVVINGVTRSRFNSAGQTITGTTSLTLNAGDRITIRNIATSPDPAMLRSGDFTTAYVLVYKVDS